MKSVLEKAFRNAVRGGHLLIFAIVGAVTLRAADECILTYPINAFGVVNESGRAASTNGLSVKSARQYLVFNVPKLQGEVVGASLSFTMQSVWSAVPLDYTFYEVTNAVARLSAGGTSVYQDLGEGKVFGGGTLDPRSTSRNVSIPLSSEFVKSFNEKAAPTKTDFFPIALGAALTGAGTSGDEFISVFWTYLMLSVAPTNPPSLLIEQNLRTAPSGGNVQFYARSRDSSCPLTGAFQWRFSGKDIAGATNAYLAFYDLTPAQTGTYIVTLSNAFGQFEATTELTVLPDQKVDAAPSVTFNGPNIEGPLGSPFRICPNIEGWPAPALQWSCDSVPLLGQTNVCLDLPALESLHSGKYTLAASNSLGQVTASIRLDVRGEKPTIAAQTAGISVVAGFDAMIYVTASGAPPPQLFVLKNGTNQPFALAYANGVSFLSLTPAEAGLYSFVASNSFGMATSQVVRVNVRESEPRDRWSSLHQDLQIRSMVFAEGLIVGVGNQGGIFTSGEPLAWDVQPRKSSGNVNAVVYTNNLFVAVTSDGLILTSKNGKTWDYSARVDRPLRCITYGNGFFVAAGDQVLLTSVDGLNWNRAEKFGLYMNALSFGNGVFVAGASDPSAPPSPTGFFLMTSNNGTDWQRVFPSEEVEQIAFLNNRFFAVGDDGSIAVSTDGSDWQLRPQVTTRRFYDVVYGAGKYVAVGARGIIFSSVDGINWTAENSGTPDRLEAALYTGKYFVAAGENGTTLISTDGSLWEKPANLITADLDGMVTTTDLVVAVGKDGTILTSTNGVNFLVQQSGVTNNLHGVGWNGNVFVAVGEPGVILTSPDAVHWTQRSIDLASSLKQAVFLNGLWLALGTGGVLLTSPDAITWNQVPHLTYNDLNDAAYGNGTYAVIGDGYPAPEGTLLTSKDGTHWTMRSIGLGKNARSIVYANGQFLVTANDSLIATSTDAAIWAPRYTYPTFFSSPGFYGRNLRSAFWTGRDWVLVGNFGTILTSPDLVTWTAPRAPTGENLHAVGRFRDRLITIGNAGFTGRSDRWFTSEFVRVTRRGLSGVDLQLQIESTGAHQLQASDNLSDWKTISVFNVDAPGRVTLQQDSAEGRTFYRIASE